ncbi:MAG TPA: thioredoxin family protein [Candidatus Melainabacteria bacterium]|nr:thioredoxin family protein [Candidatus Melainabacteria bacterium]
MKNEIKRSIVKNRLARLFAVASIAIAAILTLMAHPQANAQGQKAGDSSDKRLIAVNDLMWSTSLATSLNQAKLKRKYVLADMYTDWCGWCKRLDRDTFSNPQMMAYLNSKYVCAKINAEGNAEGRQVAAKYRVSGFPCGLVFDPSGKFIGKLSGYYKPDEYQNALEQLIKNPPSDPYAE